MFPARRNPPFYSAYLIKIKENSLISYLDPVDRGTGPIGYQSKVRVIDRYKVIGFISSGTYGRVYKAVGRSGQAGEFAIKKFKPGMVFYFPIQVISNQTKTRRENKFSTRGSHSQLFEKWPYVPNLVI